MSKIIFFCKIRWPGSVRPNASSAGLTLARANTKVRLVEFGSRKKFSVLVPCNTVLLSLTERTSLFLGLVSQLNFQDRNVNSSLGES